QNTTRRVPLVMVGWGGPPRRVRCWVRGRPRGAARGGGGGGTRRGGGGRQKGLIAPAGPRSDGRSAAPPRASALTGQAHRPGAPPGPGSSARPRVCTGRPLAG